MDIKGFNINDLLGDDAHKRYNRLQMDPETHALTVLLEDGGKETIKDRMVEASVTVKVETGFLGPAILLVEPRTGKPIAKVTKNAVIGCSKTCDIIIPADQKSHTMSRRHAELLFQDDVIYIKDISTNGTFLATVDEPTKFVRLTKDDPTPIKSDMIVKFAAKILRLEYIEGK